MSYNTSMLSARVFSQVGIVIFIFYLCYYLFTGVINPVPGLGDSWDYHIPISKMILNGQFLAPQHVRFQQWYYPGSAEAINSILMLLHIPLTLSNLLAVIVLFFCCWKLGNIANLSYYESIFFAISIVTLNVFVRWYNAISVDVWLVVFFLLGIILLERPNRTSSYFLKLGIVLGMLIGSKFSGWYLLIILTIIYGRLLIKYISARNIFIFLTPFTTLGLFWYIRNLILFSNPFFPLAFPGLPGKMVFPVKVWLVTLYQPRQMFDAFFAEYKVWMLALPIALYALCKSIRDKKIFPLSFVNRMLVLGLLSFVVFLISPSENQPWIMVSSFRYSYPSFVLLILGVFLLAKEYKKIEILSIVSIASMIMVTSFMYYPKLILIYSPLSLLVIYSLKHYKKKISRFMS